MEKILKKEQVYGPGHPWAAGSLNEFAAFLVLKKDYSSAETLMKKALQ